LLLKYVKDVQPAVMENFIEQGPSPVVAAMRTTITNMLGTLPPQFFTVTISTVGENLSQLMYSVMMTGYMFRNAQYRLELRGSFGGVQFPNGSGAAIDMVQDSQLGPAGYAHGILDQTTYAPGVQKSKVQGEVLMWHKENGLETMEAVQYMQLLEDEVARLRQQLQAAGLDPSDITTPKSITATSSSNSSSSFSSQAGGAASFPSLPPASNSSSGGSSPNGSRSGSPTSRGSPSSSPFSSTEESGSPKGQQQQEVPFHLSPQLQQQHGLATRGEELPNELLDFLRTLEPASLTSLTSSASNEVRAAMDAFVGRLMGSSDKEQLRRAASDCTAQELGKLMFWLMVVGYTLRGMEVRFEMDRALDGKGGGQSGLPPAKSW